MFSPSISPGLRGLALPLLSLVLAGPLAPAQTLAALSPAVPIDKSAACLAVADVNGDGKPDVLVANSTNKLEVLLGNGHGGFARQANSPSTGADNSPSGIAVADVNGDHKLDVLTANCIPDNVGVLLGDGRGGFTLQANSPRTGMRTFFLQADSPRASKGGCPSGIAVADVNGDGKLDVLTANFSTSNMSVLLGDGRGGFTRQANLPSTGANSSPQSVAVADVNGDGKPDALTVNLGTNTIGVLLGDGRGGFTRRAKSPSTGANSFPQGLAVADVNGDGKLDVLTANSNADNVGVLLGDGRGGFTRQANSPSTGKGSQPLNVVVADVNGDGKPDALTVNVSTNNVSVLLGDGRGGFTRQANSPSTGTISVVVGLAVADVNGDHKPDVLTANFSPGTVRVLLGNGRGDFTLQAK